MHGTSPTHTPGSLGPSPADMPEEIPVFPLSRVVLLPGEVLPLHIFEPRYRAMVEDALSGHRVIGIVEVEAGAPGAEASSSTLRNVGCAGFIAEHQRLPDGRFLIWLLGLERFTVEEELIADTLYRQFSVAYTPIEESAEQLAGLQPVRTELRQVLPRLVDLDASSRSQLEAQMGEVSDSQLIALASQILELPSLRKRELLEAQNQVDRFMLVYEELYRHLDDHPDLGDDTETMN